MDLAVPRRCSPIGVATRATEFLALSIVASVAMVLQDATDMPPPDPFLLGHLSVHTVGTLGFRAGDAVADRAVVLALRESRCCLCCF